MSRNMVSRSVYQKLVEENKKLKKDILILAHEKYSCSFERLMLIRKWREVFAEEEEFDELLREYATKYSEDHPDIIPEQIASEQKHSIEDLKEFDNHPQL